MSTVLYIRTSDGVLIRFERMAQARDWLAAGRLTLNDRFFSKDGDWQPLLDLVDFEAARVEDTVDREDLAGAVSADPGDTEIRVQVAPTWAVTTDEFLPPEGSASGETREAVSVSVPAATADDGQATDEPTAPANEEPATPVADGPTAWPLVEEAPTRREAPTDVRGVGDAPEPEDAEWGAAPDSVAAGSPWGRRLIRIAAILILAGVAGYAAWHWAGGSSDASLAEIPVPASVSPTRPPTEPVPDGPAVAPRETAADAVADPGTDDVSGRDDVGVTASKDDGSGDVAKDTAVPDEGVEARPQVRPTTQPAAAPKREPAPATTPAPLKAATAPAQTRRPPPEPRPSVPPSGRSSASASQTYDEYMAAGNRLKASDSRAALAHFSVAAEAKPGMVTPVSAMGDCAMAMGDTDQAQRYYARALRMRNSYGPALIGMARVHRRLGDNASAADFYRRYLQVNLHGSQAPEAQSFLEAQGTAP